MVINTTRLFILLLFPDDHMPSSSRSCFQHPRQLTVEVQGFFRGRSHKEASLSFSPPTIITRKQHVSIRMPFIATPTSDALMRNEGLLCSYSYAHWVN